MQSKNAIASEYDVFVSYQRKYDKQIKTLSNQLRAYNLHPWVDFDEIRAEEWWASIRRGIERSRTFLFLLSKESLDSKICQCELAYARQYNKTVIIYSFVEKIEDAVAGRKDDTVYTALEGLDKDVDTADNLEYLRNINLNDIDKDVDTADNLEYLSKINLIPLLDKAKIYQESLKKIIDAITGDLEHERSANQYLQEALEWDRSNSGLSYLLTGEKLSKATSWFRQAQSKNKYPASITADFINESQRQHEIKQQRRSQILIGFTVTVVFVAIVMFFLTLLAEQRRMEADTQRQEAEYQEGQANIASTKVVNQLNQTQNVLQTQAINERAQMVELGEKTSLPTLSGAFIWLSLTESNGIRQFRTDTGEAIGDIIPTGNKPQQPIYDDGLVWVASADRVTRVEATIEPTVDQIMIPEEVQQIMIQDGWLWVVTEEPKQLVVYNTQTLQVSASIPLDFWEGLVAVNESFAWLVDTTTNQLIRVRAQDGSRSEASLGFSPMQPIVTPTHIWIADSASGLLYTYDIQTVSPIRDPQSVGRSPGPITDDGQFIWIFSPIDNILTQYDRESADYVRTITLPQSPQLIFRESHRIWVFTTAGLFSYDVSTGSELSKSPEIQGVSQTIPVSDGRKLWIANPNNSNLLAVDLESGEVKHVIRNCQTPQSPLFDHATIWVLCTGTRSLMRIPAMITYHQLGALGRPISPQQPYIDDETAWILLENENQIARINLDTGMLLDDEIILNTHDTVPEESTIMFGDQLIWILRETNGQIIIIDPTTLEQTVHDVGAWVQQITPIENTIWITGVNREGDDLFIFDRDTGELLRSHNLGMLAIDPTYDAEQGVVWIASTTFVGSLYRISIDSLDIIEPVVEVGGAPAGLRVQGDSVWLTAIFSEFGWETIYDAYEGGFQGEVYRVRRSNAEIISKIVVNEFPRDSIFASGLIWLSQTQFLGDNNNSISAIDPTTLEVKLEWDLCNHPAPPFYDNETGLIWYTCTNIDAGDVGDVMIIDTESLNIVQHYQGLGLSGWEPKRIGDTVWIVYQSSNNIAVFDANSGALLQLLAIGGRSTPLTIDKDGTAWIANRDDSTVQQVIVKSYSLES